MPSNSTTDISVCATVLLRHRSAHMNLLPKIASMILNCGLVSKQVYIDIM